MPVNHNIGFLRDLIDKTLRSAEEIRTMPEPDPYDQFTDYNDVRCSDSCESPNSFGVFYWGIHKWGDEVNVVGS
jgi:hypothetical protein